MQDFFSTPCPSRHVRIVKCEGFSACIEAVDLRKVQKCIAFVLNDREFYVCKLLHETVEL